MTPIEYVRETAEWLKNEFKLPDNIKSKDEEILDEMQKYYERNIAPEMAAIFIANKLNLNKK